MGCSCFLGEQLRLVLLLQRLDQLIELSVHDLLQACRASG